MVLAFPFPAGGVAADLLSPRFAKQVLSGRWFTLFACLLILSVSGATYAFGIYSRSLKTSLNYDQRAIATLAFFKDLGSYVGIPAGLLNEMAPPCVLLAVGAAMNLVGYLMVYLSLAGHVTRPPLWLMCVYVAAAANSQAFAGTGALVTAVRNFPERRRGNVLGLLKGYVGLSSAILAQVYLAIYGGGDARELVLLIAWLPAAVSVVFLATVRVVMVPPRRRSLPSASRSGGRGGGDVFNCLLYISMALAAYILVMIIVQRQVVFSHAGYVTSVTGLLLLLFLPIGVVVKQEYHIKNEIEASLCDDNNDDDAPPMMVTVVEKTSTLPMSLELSAMASTDNTPPPPSSSPSSSWLNTFFKDTFNPPAHGEDYTIPQAMVSIDMAILFVTIAAGTGGTLTAIDNMGQIGQSLGYPSKSVDAFVSLISIWNYAGRVTAGYASEAILISRHQLPRPLALTVVLVVSCAGHLLIAAGAPMGTLYVASVIIGFCSGAQVPVLYTVISELFGLRRYPTLYNLGAIASPVGAYMLNVRIAGRMYDAEAARQHAGGGSGGVKMCGGVECFKRSFLIVTAATVAGAVVSLVLVWRTREFYRGDIYAKFRDDAEAMAADESSPGQGQGNGRSVNGGGQRNANE